MNQRIGSNLVDRSATLRQAMEVINAAPLKGGQPGIALVVDDGALLMGCVTDGDIRRAVLKGVDLESPVVSVMTPEPIAVTKGLSSSDMLKVVAQKIGSVSHKRIRNKKIDKVIVVDEAGRVEDILTFFELWKKSDIRARDICVVGLGHIGLPLAVLLANVGFKVIGIDLNRDLVEGLKRGVVPYHETGLESLLGYHVNKDLMLDCRIEQSVADVYILCVNSPLGDNNKANLQHLEQASASVGQILKRDDLVIVRTTVPPGTCRGRVLPILEKESGLVAGTDFYLAMAPERTAEGIAIEELRKLPQIIGGHNEASAELAGSLFQRLTPSIIDVGSLEGAEMVKLINNTFRDLTFAFSNELALICDKLGLDTVKLIHSANEGYPRGKVPVPSPGVGGPCLRKDPYILMELVESNGGQPRLTRAAREINEYMPLHVAEKLIEFCRRSGKELASAKIFIVGLAFKGKPETADARDSCALDLLRHLRANGARNIYGYDPVVPPQVLRERLTVVTDPSQGFDQADCVAIMNNHESYSDLHILDLVGRMNRPGLFFDGWHIFGKETICRVDGITYEGLGVG